MSHDDMRNQQLEHAKTIGELQEIIAELQREKRLLNRIVDKRDDTIANLLETCKLVTAIPIDGYDAADGPLNDAWDACVKAIKSAT